MRLKSTFHPSPAALNPVQRPTQFIYNFIILVYPAIVNNTTSSFSSGFPTGIYYIFIILLLRLIRHVNLILLHFIVTKVHFEKNIQFIMHPIVAFPVADNNVLFSKSLIISPNIFRQINKKKLSSLC